MIDRRLERPVLGGVPINADDQEAVIWDETIEEWIPAPLVAGLSAVQIKALYESNPNTNAFTDAEQSQLAALDYDGPEDNYILARSAGAGPVKLLADVPSFFARQSGGTHLVKVAVPTSTIIGRDAGDFRPLTIVEVQTMLGIPSGGAGDVVGPAGAVADNIVTFDGPTGKLVKDSGKSIGLVTFGPASSQAKSIPRFDPIGLGDIEDPNILILDAVDVHPTGSPYDIGKPLAEFRDLYLSRDAIIGRFALASGGVMAGAGTTGYPAMDPTVGLLVAPQQTDFGANMRGMIIAPEFDGDSAGNPVIGTFFSAEINATWEPGAAGSSIDVMSMNCIGGRAAPAWTGPVSAINVLQFSLSLDAPQLVAALNGIRLDSITLGTTPPTQSASLNIGTGNGTRHYGIVSNSDWRLRGVRELWFGPLIETGTPLSSIHAKAISGQIITMKINAADNIFQFENTGVNNAAQLWMCDESSATDRFVKTKFLSNPAMTADRVWTINVQNANRTLSLGGNVTFPSGSAYTPTNVTTDRSFDANSTTMDELADVLGTLIADLQTAGAIP